MIIRDIRWRAYRLPFRVPFATARGAMRFRDGIIVEIITTDGITGLGEIAPLPEPGGVSIENALALLPDVAAMLCGQNVEDILTSVGAGVDADAGLGRLRRPSPPDATFSSNNVEMICEQRAAQAPHPPITTTPAPTERGLICGLETALLDALAKAQGISLAVLLASPGVQPRASIRVNAVIGARDIEIAAAAAQQAALAGYRCIKLKVGMEQDADREIARIARVRAAIGPDVALRLDANEAWDMQQAQAVLSGCARYDIQYVEQPLPRHDLHGLRKLREAIDIPIAVDEALDSLDSAQRLLADHLAGVFVIKPQALGGLRITQRLIDEAAASGVQCIISSSLESGIGLAALLHLAAASPAIALECGLATAHLLADDLIIEDLPIENGAMAVPPAMDEAIAGTQESRAMASIAPTLLCANSKPAGLGVTLDEQALKAYGYDR